MAKKKTDTAAGLSSDQVSNREPVQVSGQEPDQVPGQSPVQVASPVMDVAGYENVTVRVSDLMQFFGIAERTVYDWGSKGMPGLGGGLFNFAAVVKWRMNELLDDLDEAKKGDATLYYLKQETQKRIILQKELEIQKMSGKLIDASMVKVAWVSEMRMISRKMSALAYRLNALLNGDPEQLERIKKEVDDLRADIVKTEFRMHEDEEIDEEELKAIGEINMDHEALVDITEGDTDDDE